MPRRPPCPNPLPSHTIRTHLKARVSDSTRSTQRDQCKNAPPKATMRGIAGANARCCLAINSGKFSDRPPPTDLRPRIQCIPGVAWTGASLGRRPPPESLWQAPTTPGIMQRHRWSGVLSTAPARIPPPHSARRRQRLGLRSESCRRDIAWPQNGGGRHPPDSVRDFSQFSAMNAAPEGPPRIVHRLSADRHRRRRLGKSGLKWSGCKVRIRLWPRLPHGCHRPLSNCHCPAASQCTSWALPTPAPAPAPPSGPCGLHRMRRTYWSGATPVPCGFRWPHWATPGGAT